MCYILDTLILIGTLVIHFVDEENGAKLDLISTPWSELEVITKPQVV